MLLSVFFFLYSSWLFTFYLNKPPAQKVSLDALTSPSLSHSLNQVCALRMYLIVYRPFKNHRFFMGFFFVRCGFTRELTFCLNLAQAFWTVFSF